jgi:hypothetical protein
VTGESLAVPVDAAGATLGDPAASVVDSTCDVPEVLVPSTPVVAST